MRKFSFCRRGEWGAALFLIERGKRMRGKKRNFLLTLIFNGIIKSLKRRQEKKNQNYKKISVKRGKERERQEKETVKVGGWWKSIKKI